MAKTRYDIRNLAGALQAVHIRHDKPDGTKDRMSWESPDGSPNLAGRPVASLPLYGSQDLHEWPQDAPVVITEGEKDCQALIDAGIPALGTVTGASACPTAEVLSVLKGRRIILWPDADDVGEKHMLCVSEHLETIAAELRWIKPPRDVASGWGAADAVAEARDTQALIDAAEPLTTVTSIWTHEAPNATRFDPPRIDAADLLELELEPLREIVPGLLPEGTTVLASPPKVGKSCLVYQIAVEVALGGELFGKRIEPGSALYLALEDGPRRGQERLQAALSGRTMPRGRLEIWRDAPSIGDGLEEQIDDWLATHPDAAFVAVDTLGRVRPQRGGKANLYDMDVQDVARLQKLVRDRNVALLLVHHVRKDPTGDFLDAVSGSYGISGSVDTVMVVRRKRGQPFGVIQATGREIAEAELSVRFDNQLWHVAPRAMVMSSPERAEVYQVIVDSGPILAKAIADCLGLGRTSVQNMVKGLVDEGAIRREAKGYVSCLPHDSHDSESHLSHRAGSRNGDLTAAARDVFGDMSQTELGDRAILGDAA